MLKEKIQSIIQHIEKNENFISYNKDIFNILEGDLLSYIKVSLREQKLSDKSYNSVVQSISPINIIKRVTDKLTKLYNSNVKRIATVDGKHSKDDQEVIDWYVNNLKIDKYMDDFNYFLNSTKVSLIEPYLDSEDNPKIRTIPSHRFLVYSDDPIEPNKPTILIKFMGEKEKEGKKVNIYFIYSDEEFLAIDSDGDVLPEYMSENNGENIYGIIPAIYGNTSDYQLIPTPDYDLKQMGVLIPVMFSTGNDALKWMSFSIVYGIDLDAENLEQNPNAFWVFKSDENRTPKIGQIKPEVDTSKIIENIMVQLDAWLETKGIKASSAGRARGDNSLNGISLMIKEMDTTQALKSQMTKMEEIEKRFWKMMARVHNDWVVNNYIKDLPFMDEDVNVKVEYELPRPVESEDERLERAIKVKNEGLATLKDAILIWKPKLEDDELNQKIEELKAESEITVFETDENNQSDQSQADENTEQD